MGNKRRGTFVECGAFDGETASNTLELEYFYDWKGVLVEPNPFYYSQVRMSPYMLHKTNIINSLPPPPFALIYHWRSRLYVFWIRALLRGKIRT